MDGYVRFLGLIRVRVLFIYLWVPPLSRLPPATRPAVSGERPACDMSERPTRKHGPLRRACTEHLCAGGGAGVTHVVVTASARA